MRDEPPFHCRPSHTTAFSPINKGYCRFMCCSLLHTTANNCIVFGGRKGKFSVRRTMPRQVNNALTAMRVKQEKNLAASQMGMGFICMSRIPVLDGGFGAEPFTGGSAN